MRCAARLYCVSRAGTYCVRCDRRIASISLSTILTLNKLQAPNLQVGKGMYSMCFDAAPRTVIGIGTFYIQRSCYR